MVELDSTKSGPSGANCPSCGHSLRLSADGTAEYRLAASEKPIEVDLPFQLSHYQLLKPLGQGGMGRVFLAQDTRLGRQVALKLLSPHYLGDSQHLERFQREARMASALNHPYICTIYDIGEDRGQPFIVMELIEGQTLRMYARRERSLMELLRLGGQVAQALAAAHAEGIVHRDIKPENVMVRPDGYVKILDFGLARPILSGIDRASGEPADLTQLGALVGTLRYMSPEQARGEGVSSASDIFSLGIVFYELATGRNPFQAESQLEILQAILSHPAMSPKQLNPEMETPVAGMIQQMLSKDPRLRPTATEVASTLTDVGRPVSERSSIAPISLSGRHTVGRQKELAEMNLSLESVRAGRAQFLCVTGEPGIGKTTLIEDFLTRLTAPDQPCTVGRGRCSERLAGTEAYLPFLEALESILYGAPSDVASRVLKTVAPHWYIQVAPLAAEDSSLARALVKVEAASQERLKRELVAFLQELSGVQPLILFLDDVHWADTSTIDLLAYLAGRCDGLPLLLVLAYRPTDLALSGHPFGPLKLDLQMRGVCREVALEFLTRTDIQRYLALEFPEHDLPDEFATLVHKRTEGSPLFMADLLRYLRDKQVLTQKQGQWTLGRSIPDLKRQLPESIRSMIQRKIEQLDEQDRRLLVAASVQGSEFDSLVIAEALARDPADVEERLETLGRVHRFVRLLQEKEFPDRMPTLQYVFVHVLYQNALYASLQPTRRAKLSAAVAEKLLKHYGDKNAEVAAELALLLEGARDFARAAEYCLLAAKNAVRVFANHEAVVLARRGLGLLEKLPDTADRARRELATLITLGPPLKDTQGWAAPEIERIYTRAHKLCEQIGQTPDLFPALWGLWIYHSSVSKVSATCDMGLELLSLAQRAQDTEMLLQAHHALASTHIMGGGMARRSLQVVES